MDACAEDQTTGLRYDVMVQDFHENEVSYAATVRIKLQMVNVMWASDRYDKIPRHKLVKPANSATPTGND